MRELALFAGAGGGILGGYLNGWETVCAVEWEPYAAAVLVARQNDGCLPAFPVWDDIRTFDGRRWRGRVDVVSGGFPCQDISAAGKGAGIDGERSGMWREMARVIGEVEPGVVLVENSPLLVGRGLARVLGDLAQMGYDARWGIVGADDAGAPHRRKRIWIVGYSKRPERWTQCGAREGLEGKDCLSQREEGPGGLRIPSEDVAYAGCSGEVRNSRVDDIGIGEAIGASEAIPHADGAGCEWEGPAQPAGREHAAESVGGGADVPHADIFHGDGGGHGAGALCGERGEASRVCGGADVEHADVPGCEHGGQSEARGGESGAGERDDRAAGSAGGGIAAGGWWESEPALGRVADGVAHRVGQLRALGNGQVAAVVRLAWEKLGSGNFEE